MQSNTAYDIRPAGREDAAEILALRHAAFRAVAERYHDPNLPPLVENLHQVACEPDHYIVFKAVLPGGRLIGAIRAVEHDGIVHIGRLAVHPDHQSMGVGTELTRQIIEHFPDAESFELFTGHKCHAPLTVYEKLGFEAVRSERRSEHLVHVYLQRPGSGNGGAENGSAYEPNAGSSGLPSGRS